MDTDFPPGRVSEPGVFRACLRGTGQAPFGPASKWLNVRFLAIPACTLVRLKPHWGRNTPWTPRVPRTVTVGPRNSSPFGPDCGTSGLDPSPTMLSHCSLALALAAFASLGSIAEADGAGLKSQCTTAASCQWAHTDPAGSAHERGASRPHAGVRAIDAAERTSESQVDAADEAPDAAGVGATLLGLLPQQRSSARCAGSATERTRLVVSTWLARGPPQHVER